MNDQTIEKAARQLLEAVEDFQGYRQDIDTAIADLHEALEAAPQPARQALETMQDAAFDEQGWRKIVNALQASNQLGLAALSRPTISLEP